MTPLDAQKSFCSRFCLDLLESLTLVETDCQESGGWSHQESGGRGQRISCWGDAGQAHGKVRGMDFASESRNSVTDTACVCSDP